MPRLPVPFLLGAALFASALGVVPSAAIAGPCADRIVETQAAVDRAIATNAQTGPTAPESADALLSRQPTPDAIAQEEAALGDSKGPERALRALGLARAADATGDLAACDRLVAAARKALQLP